jgi:redox-sensitive bicupin YhaK (pirin superfamily)
MDGLRAVREVMAARPTVEGAGVRLKRAFGSREAPQFDPFLMLDDFHSSEPADYAAGFPWHPHRGMETITYMLAGEVEHQDSMGNRGVIGPGDVQWMTAGSGIIHQEMPRASGGTELWGLQLWANLPASRKMMAPRYQEIRAQQVPVVETDGGAEVRVICGELAGTRGPVRDIVTDPGYLDVSIPAEGQFFHAMQDNHTVFAYVLEGAGLFSPEDSGEIGREHAVLFGPGEAIRVTTSAGVRFVLVSGKPVAEPVAWGGPVVMNTQRELEEAFREYEEGTFIKLGAA